MNRTLLCFGCGYSATTLAARLTGEGGWRVIGTTRGAEGAVRIEAAGAEARFWPESDLSAELEEATHLLVSVPPGEKGDSVLASEAKKIAARGPKIRWAGYLSTTAVYGNHDGKWVDEFASTAPTTRRGMLRAQAEQDWTALSKSAGFPLRIFRLAGIYGPGRGPLAQLASGRKRIILKKNQVFNRIHVDDIANVLRASMDIATREPVYNVCDDLPAPPERVIEFAARLIGAEIPEAVPFERAELSPMARSFYSESKRVSNELMKRDLIKELQYPDFFAGLAELAKSMPDSSEKAD